MARRRARSEQPSPPKPPSHRRASKARSRAHRSTILLRWCVLATVGLVVFLYFQPVSSYFETRAALSQRAAEVRQLRAERQRLQARLAESATIAALSREARRMGLVRPGERLFIVKGVQEWRRAQATIERDG